MDQSGKLNNGNFIDAASVIVRFGEPKIHNRLWHFAGPKKTAGQFVGCNHVAEQFQDAISYVGLLASASNPRGMNFTTHTAVFPIDFA